MAILRITLKSDLCAGSGEATGVAVDKDLCISEAGLPSIPARRIKGCLREAAMQLQRCGCSEATKPNIETLFGTSTGVEGCLDLRDAVLPGTEAMEAWLKTGVPPQMKQAAAPLNVARIFTSVLGQTKLENGVAVDNTLRYTRVLNHYSALESDCETTLEASVFLRSEGDTSLAPLCSLLEKSCKALRHIGSLRNRGLGEIRAELLEKDTLIAEAPSFAKPQTDAPTGEPDTLIRYRVALNAPVTLPGCAEELNEIPARSVIGCAAAAYLRHGKAEDVLFRRLFLDGTVRWSALTPSVDGVRSVPTPLMLVRLKNEKRCHNLYASGSAEGSKQKTLDGSFAAPAENGFHVTAVRTHTVYHHSTGEDGTLYMQSALDAGMVYAGELRVPAALAETVKELLRKTSFAFGRSRSAQYASCSLLDEPEAAPIMNPLRATEPGAPIYAVLQSDLLLTSAQGLFEVGNGQIRAALATALGAENTPVEGKLDYCMYHHVGGYQATWQLQKPQLLTARGGSVFTFRSKGEKLPVWLTLGELPQEGFGLFRLYTEAEMRTLSEIADAPVDRKKTAFADSAPCQQLRSALLAAAMRAEIRDSAIRLHKSGGAPRLGKGTVGRLRLMLAEADSLSDLRKRVDTIKESDKSSENQTPQKKLAEELLTRVYGAAEQPSWDVLLSESPSGKPLLPLLRVDRFAWEKLMKNWKEPLDILLHLAHYEKAKGEE